MSASARMNDLALRRRLLTMQANLHRERLGLECVLMHERWATVCSATKGNRWWLVAGALAGGALLSRHWRGLARSLPLVVSLWRMMKG